MASDYSASRTQFPLPVADRDPANKGYVDASSSGAVPLGDLYQPLTGVWPAVDATYGPLTSDAGITNVTPSFTDLTYYSWNSGKFNTQSQNWQAVPTTNSGITTNLCCQNTTTNRGNNYAGTGLGFPTHSDFSFVAGTTKLIIAYFQTTTFSASQGVYTSNHDVQIFAEHEGKLKGVRSEPATWPNGSGGNQMFYRVVTFSRAMQREFRVMMSAGCWFAGIYVDNGALVTKAPNRPVLMGCFGDSWAEGGGNVWSFYGGNGAAAGVNWPTGCSLLYSNTAIQYAIATGFAVIICHQGGTGYFGNLNSGISEDDTSQLGFTSFGSQNQVDYFWNNWGTRNPMAGIFGGWNDGAGYSTNQYQVRADKIYRKFLAKDPTIPILVQGIQSVRVANPSGYNDANTGLQNAVVALKTAGYNMCGFINDLADANYQDFSSAAGQNIGPDTLHPTVKGGQTIGMNRAKRSAAFTVPRGRVVATLAALA